MNKFNNETFQTFLETLTSIKNIYKKLYEVEKSDGIYSSNYQEVTAYLNNLLKIQRQQMLELNIDLSIHDLLIGLLSSKIDKENLNNVSSFDKKYEYMRAYNLICLLYIDKNGYLKDIPHSAEALIDEMKINQNIDNSKYINLFNVIINRNNIYVINELLKENYENKTSDSLTSLKYLLLYTNPKIEELFLASDNNFDKYVKCENYFLEINNMTKGAFTYQNITNVDIFLNLYITAMLKYSDEEINENLNDFLLKFISSISLLLSISNTSTFKKEIEKIKKTISQFKSTNEDKANNISLNYVEAIIEYANKFSNCNERKMCLKNEN